MLTVPKSLSHTALNIMFTYPSDNIFLLYWPAHGN
jgi:hypothetical protein